MCMQKFKEFVLIYEYLIIYSLSQSTIFLSLRYLTYNHDLKQQFNFIQISTKKHRSREVCLGT